MTVFGRHSGVLRPDAAGTGEVAVVGGSHEPVRANPAIIAQNAFCGKIRNVQLCRRRESLPFWESALTKPKSAVPLLILALTLLLIGTDTPLI